MFVQPRFLSVYIFVCLNVLHWDEYFFGLVHSFLWTSLTLCLIYSFLQKSSDSRKQAMIICFWKQTLCLCMKTDILGKNIFLLLFYVCAVHSNWIMFLMLIKLFVFSLILHVCICFTFFIMLRVMQVQWGMFVFGVTVCPELILELF